jgi:hypothetical protein
VIPSAITKFPLVGPSLTKTSLLTTNHVSLEVEINMPLDCKTELAGCLVDRTALEIFRNNFERPDLVSLATDVKLSGGEDLHRQLLRYSANPTGYEGDEAKKRGEVIRDRLVEIVQRSMYKCPPINFDLDIVYLTDASSPWTLGKFWSKQWAHKAQRVALLIADRTSGAEWHPDTLIQALDEPGLQRRVVDCAAEEVYLVVLPEKMTEDRFGAIDRDDYGFIPYDANMWADMETWWNMRIARQYGSTEMVLKKRFPTLMATTKIKWVIDVDNRQGYDKSTASEKYPRFLRQTRKGRPLTRTLRWVAPSAVARVII